MLDRYFSKSHINISIHCLLNCKVYTENSAYNLMEAPLYVTSHFSPAALKILSFALTLHSLIIMCFSVGFFGSILLEISWVSYEYIHFLIKFGKYSAIFLQTRSLPLSLFSFWDSQMRTLVRLMIFCKSLRICSLFFIIIRFCSSILTIDFLQIHWSFLYLFKSAIEHL